MTHAEWVAMVGEDVAQFVARHHMGMPVYGCECDGCARVKQERREQFKRGLLATQALRDAGIDVDPAKVEQWMRDASVRVEEHLSR